MPTVKVPKKSDSHYRNVFDNWNPILIAISVLIICLLSMNIYVVYYFLAFVVIIIMISFTIYHTFKLPPPSKFDSESFFSSKIYGHRGCGGIDNIDEGSLKAFEYAYNSGANGIECDIRLTKDRVPIIIHDYHMKNVTYYDLYHKALPSLNFHELTLKEIKSLSLKFNAKVMQLSELIDFMKTHKYTKPYMDSKHNGKNGDECDAKEHYFRLLLEFKHCTVNGYTYDDLRNIMSIVDELDDKNERVIFISFSVCLIYRLRRLYRDINIGLIFERHMWWTWMKQDVQVIHNHHRLLFRFVDPIHTFLCQYVLPYFCGCCCVGVRYHLVSEFTCDHFINREGINIFCWGPKNKIDIQWLLSKGVCVVADDPKHAIKCGKEMDGWEYIQK